MQEISWQNIPNSKNKDVSDCLCTAYDFRVADTISAAIVLSIFVFFVIVLVIGVLKQ